MAIVEVSIEGDLEEVMKCVLKMHEVPFQKGGGRVYTTIKVDDRRDRPITIEGKVHSVMSKLREK
ncbi:MAG: thiamine-binding protein [Deltaproteobacteria bacterium]|nr:thiamine-binding protein [Deltaproteobacteria bacterium]